MLQSEMKVIGFSNDPQVNFANPRPENIKKNLNYTSSLGLLKKKKKKKN